MNLVSTQIAGASREALARVLQALCSDPAVAEHASKLLGSRSPGSGRPIAGTKRKAEAQLIECRQCGEAVDMDQTHERACLFHDGDLEHDDETDAWADCDEYHYHNQNVNTETWWRDNPDGFVWSCCGKRGTNAGCTRGPHQPFSGQRRRFGDDMSDCPDSELSDEVESPEQTDDDESTEDEGLNEDEEEY